MKGQRIENKWEQEVRDRQQKEEGVQKHFVFQKENTRDNKKSLKKQASLDFIAP